MTIAIGRSSSKPAMSPASTSGSSATAVATAVITSGATRSSPTRRMSSRPKVTPSRRRTFCKWLVSTTTLRTAIAKTASRPKIEPSESTPPLSQHRQYAAGQHHGHGQPGDQRQAPAAKACLQQQVRAQQGDQRNGQGTLLRGLPIGGFTQHLGMELARELDHLQSPADIGRHRRQVAPLHGCLDVYIA